MSDMISNTQQALWLVLLLAGPTVAAAAIVGILVAIIQAVTQIQEQTLQFALKFVVVVLSIFATASLMGGSLYQFSNRIFTEFPQMVGG